MNYIEVRFFLGKSDNDYAADLLKGDLLSIGFESFMDNDDGSFCAYCKQEDFSKDKLLAYNNLNYSISVIEDRDWNSVWEENSPSVLFGNFCNVRKQSQPFKQVKYDIIINPKQSFGTANHPTTSMIITYLQKIEKDIKNKSVLDMGCGTGVLAILSKKMGAKYVEAIDIDDWAYKNVIENATVNNVELTIRQGSSNVISKDKKFDFIYANINLNILLENMIFYSKALKDNGYLILSGFYDNDTKELLEETKKLNLTFYYQMKKDDWALLVLNKKLL